MVAFAVPQDLRIKHVTAIKPLLETGGPAAACIY
jgi:hypothetical protein